MIGLVFNSIQEVENAILDNIKNVSINASKKVDAEFGREFKLIIKKMAEIYRILDIVTNYQDREIEDIKLDSKMLLWQGANSLIGALQLIRLGYFVEPNFLTRHAVENLSITLVLFKDYRRYKDFKSDKLSGEKCIGEAKKVITQIGQIYGQLSDITHPSKKWLGTYVVEKRGTMLIGGGVVDEHLHRVKLNLSTLGFLCSVYHSGVELVFYDSLKIHKFWRKTDHNSFTWSPSEEEKKYGNETKKIMREVIKELNHV